MFSLSSLIQFLLDLLHDPDVAADFARDPQGTLASNGLAGLTAQDVRDVQPLLADQAGVALCRPAEHDEPVHHHHAAVREIHHVQATHAVVQHESHHPTGYHLTEHTTVEYNQHYEFTYVDNGIHAAQGATVISDSFNEDNDGIDNKNGHIDDSTVAGHDADGSGNTATQTTVSDSFGDDHSTTATDSGNETHTVAVADSGNDDGPHYHHILSTDHQSAVHSSLTGDTVNGSYDVGGPLAHVPGGEETALVGAHPAGV